jgi:hypothetical protein
MNANEARKLLDTKLTSLRQSNHNLAKAVELSVYTGVADVSYTFEQRLEIALRALVQLEQSNASK